MNVVSEVEPEKSSISVTVQDSEGVLIDKAVVAITGPMNQNCKTGKSGNCLFIELVPGDYNIEVVRDGYDDVTEPVTLGSTEHYVTVITMYEEYVEPDKYTVTIHVTDTNDIPIVGATVKLEGTTSVTTQTDSNGDAVFLEIEKELYNIIVTHESYYAGTKTDVYVDTTYQTTISLEKLSIFDTINTMSIIVSAIIAIAIIVVASIPKIPLPKNLRIILIICGIALGIVLYFVFDIFEVFV